MIRNVLLDTGPLAALVNSKDRWHGWTRAQFSQILPPLVTCESVVSEACFLARRMHGGTESILGLIERDVIQLSFDLHDHFVEVSSLMRRYADVTMSLADASLVRMSELISDCTVLTFDTDFRVYRRHGRKSIPLLIPPNL